MRRYRVPTLLLIALLLMLVPALGRAQTDQRTYRLRTLPGDEYLRQFSGLTHRLRWQTAGAYAGYEHQQIFMADVSQAFFSRYPNSEDASFSQLLNTYDAMQLAYSGMTDERERWIVRMVETWIAERDLDLSSVRYFHVAEGNFHVSIRPRDFNNDGVNEYVLDITKGELTARNWSACTDAETMVYVVVEQTRDGYRFISPRLPFVGLYLQARGHPGGLMELDFRDINANGLLEWILMSWGIMYGGSHWNFSGQFYALEWQNGELYDLFASSGAGFYADNRYCGLHQHHQEENIAWSIENTDNDAPLEVTTTYPRNDNWDCSRVNTTHYDWNTERNTLQYVETERLLEDSRGCWIQQAQSAMWSQDYATAIPLLEQVFSAGWRGSDLELLRLRTPYGYRSPYPYFRAQLIMAYLMTGQNERAVLHLNMLDQLPVDETMQQWVYALALASWERAAPLRVCIAAYNHFAREFDRIPHGLGRTEDDLDSTFYFPYRPERIGCDALAMFRQTLANARVPIMLSPLEYLNSLGIRTVRHLEISRSEHQSSDWLVWPDIEGMVLHFAPDEDHLYYTIIEEQIDRFRNANEITGWIDPDGEITIATLNLGQSTCGTPWALTYDVSSEASCEYFAYTSPECVGNLQARYPAVRLTLWHKDKGVFVTALETLQCETQLDAIAEQASAGTFALREAACLSRNTYSCDESINIPRTYTWNAARRQYEREDDTTSSSTLTSDLRTPQRLRNYLYLPENRDRWQQLRRNNMLKQATLPYNDSNPRMSRFDYEGDLFWRATTLLKMGRDDEALAQFVQIMQSAPDSIWADVAALHVEQVAQ